jgi:hypothetical protein
VITVCLIVTHRDWSHRLDAASTAGSSYAFRTQANGAQRRYPRCSVAVVAVVAALSSTLEQIATKARFLGRN